MGLEVNISQELIRDSGNKKYESKTVNIKKSGRLLILNQLN